MRPIIVQPGEGKEVTAFGDTIVFKPVGEQTGNGITLGVAITPPCHVPEIGPCFSGGSLRKSRL